jgi:ATP-dependent Lon protease
MKKEKDSSHDLEIITDLTKVHPVGVFCQITDFTEGKNGDVVSFAVFSHRRIQANGIVTASKEVVEDAIVRMGDGNIVSEDVEAVGAADCVLSVNLAILSTSIPVVNVENMKTEPIQDQNFVNAMVDQLLSHVKSLIQISPLLQLGLHSHHYFAGSNAIKVLLV